MAKFIFPMEQILNIKRKLERQEQIKLGEVMRKLSAAMQMLQIIGFKQKDALDKYQKTVMSGQLIHSEVKKLGDSINYYHNAYKSQEELIKDLENEVEEARRKLQEAVKERKTYEILREKAYEAYLEEEKQEEAKIVDEIVSYKYRE